MCDPWFSRPQIRDLGDQGLNIEFLKNAIRDEFSNLNLVERENADLKVNIGITLDEIKTTRETTLSEALPYVGQRNYHWESKEVVTGKYEEGTVMIDLVDVKKNILVWEGFIIGAIPNNQAKKEKRINDGVKKLFANYPN